MEIPSSHPRKVSLDVRHRLTLGFEGGIVAQAGLIAHGRGEAFDYLLGERTHERAREAERAAVAALLVGNRPVVSVNGNAAALCAAEIVALADAVGASLEVNLYYRTLEREERIRDVLLKVGAKEVWGVGVSEKTIPGLDSPRGLADRVQVEADVVFLMVEDGDRTERLKDMGKTMISVDLNPLSRTAVKSDITIVDNIVRALPNMLRFAKELRGWEKGQLERVVDSFDNKMNLKEMEEIIRSGFKD